MGDDLEQADLLSFPRVLSALQEEMRLRLLKEEELLIRPLKVGPSILKRIELDKEVKAQFPPRVLLVNPRPTKLLLSADVAYDFLVGLRGSDLYVDEKCLSLTSPEVAFHANFVLGLLTSSHE